MKLFEPGAGAVENFSRTFLSNFWPAVVMYDGETYASVEHAYQAAKTLDPDLRRAIREAPTGAAAKKKGQSISPTQLRADWPELKLQVMEDLLRQKFAHADLKAQLLATAPKRLVEGNTWGDTFWGVYKGRGSNHLGALLMRIRAEMLSGTP
jgi:hypothetical protein